MEYLKKYGVTNQEIENLKNKYNDGIVSFINDNEIFITNTIDYLYSEKIKCIYLLMINNIKIFLETTTALKNKIDKMKANGMQRRQIQFKLLEER